MPKERLIPQAIEAEQSVLGALLLGPEVKFEIVDLLSSPEMFYREPHRRIFEAIMAVDVVDIVSVGDELERRGQLKAVGGNAYLTELVNATPTSIHARHYAQIVQRTAILRNFLELPTQIMDLIYSEATDVDHVWSKIRSAVDAVQPKFKDESILEWADSIGWYFELQTQRLDDREKRDEGRLVEVAFPWRSLSGHGRIKRLRPGTMAIVSAYPGAGKTAFAECCAEHWAKRGLMVLFFHFELSHEVMLDRRTARHTDLSMDELDNGVELSDLGAVSDLLNSWTGNITYVHCPGWTASRVAAFCETWSSRHPLDAVVIDYFQKIAYDRANRFGLTAAQARGQMAEACKNMAESLGLPVLMLSQLNRDGKIRDTGELEEKANVLIEIERERDSLTGKYVTEATLKVLKNTMGQVFNTSLGFNGRRYQWADMAMENGDGD